MSKKLTTRICLWAAFLFNCVVAKAQPTAQFTATPISGCAPLVVNFQDQSTGSPTQWKWDLGNSTISFLQNPSATYFNPGLYTVKLKVQNAAGKDSITKTKFIIVYALPSVSFSANSITGCYPLPVQFFNTSTAGSGTITKYLWDFGDGNTAVSANPSHVYTTAGNYNISLMITNSNGCIKTLTRTNYISITNGVQAIFTNNAPASCSPPETIQFQNQSIGSGILSYQWNFGDGGVSVLANPSHTYTAAGSYTVQLMVVNSTGCRDTTTHTSAINIGAVHADFNMPDTVCAGTTYPIVNKSLPAPLSNAWSFGDGTTSLEASPFKAYASAGIFQVKLVSDFGGCKDSIIKNVVVLPKPSSGFTGSPISSCSAPLTVNFSNSSLGGTEYQWSFGDGTGSTAFSPAHTYSTSGNYTITLVTKNVNGCTDTLVKPGYINIQLPQASINNLPQEGCAPFSWQFAATFNTSDPIISYLWDFGDGRTSTAVNPSHIFSAGIFDIKLIVTTQSGCKDTVVVKAGIKSSMKPAANFSATPRDVCANFPVKFTDLSTGTITEWLWAFGDGAQSAEQNPSHVYEDTGFFNIRLIVGNNSCYDTLEIPDYIHVKPPIAKFNVIVDCAQPFLRIFTDMSIGADEWNWDFGDGATSTAQNPSHTYAAAGTYVIKLLVRNFTSGCEYTKTGQLTIADEEAKFSATFLELCKNTATTFNAVEKNPGGILNFEWTFGDGATGTGSSASHIYTLAGAYTVSLVITDAAGCRDTLTKTNYIRVNGPTAQFIPSVPGSCLLTNIVFNDQSVNDGMHAITKWSWNYGDGSFETLTSSPFQHSYANAGLYTVTLVVKDTYGCSDSLTKNSLLVISTPVAVFSSLDTLTCPSKPVIFSNNSTGPGLTYNWDFGDGTVSTAAAPTHTYATTGNFTVHLAIKDIYGCTAEITRPQYIKIVSPLANFTISDSVSTCPPLIVQFTNMSQNQVAYNWDFGDGTFSSSPDPSHFYNRAGTFFPKLTITGPGGCTSVKTRKIVIRGPKGNFTYSNITGCKPLTVSFVATSQDRTSFIWDFNDGTIVPTSDSVISHTYTVPGIYVPKMILKDAAGCTVPITGPDTIVVSGVNASFTADTLLRCSSGFVAFTNESVSNDVITGYLWDFGDGTTSTDSNPTHFYATEGLFTTKLQAFTLMGCRDSSISALPVKVVRTPSISITKSPDGCVPLKMDFAGNLLNADTSKITWQWDLSDGRKPSGQTLNQLLFPTAGSFNATLYATNSSGCKDTALATINAYALPVVNAGIDKTICQGTGQTLNASGAATYSWSPALGLSCINCPNPVATPNLLSQYVVTGTSAQGCVNKDSVNVGVKLPFRMQRSPGDTLCAGQSAILTASGAFTYTWSPSAGLNNTNSSRVVAKPEVTTNYMLVGADEFGCFKDTAYFPVKVYPVPTVTAGPDQTINVGQSITLTPKVSPDVQSVIWTPTGSIFRSSYPSIAIKPTQTTQYKVEVANAGGCVASSQVTVYVLCNGANVFIPNTFSPNGDGANEVFYPRGTGLFSIKSARVFNRWGELVYEKNNFQPNDAGAGWDGTYHGQKLLPDVFVYMFEIICDNNTTLVYKGNIALIR
ncbi:MAG: PKD domain-containing protein [Ferruginibacter sp.]